MRPTAAAKESFAFILQRALFFSLYDHVIYPLLIFTFHFLARFHKKIHLGLEMRKRTSTGILPWLNWQRHQHPIWIHCASGEFEYAKPVIRALKKEQPQTKIMVTYFSPSFATEIQNFAGVDFACPVPWDRQNEWLEFLEHHRPQCLLISRTDVWPNMVRSTRNLRIPSLLFSATVSGNSKKTRGIKRWINKIILSSLTQVFCVSEADEENFKHIGLSYVKAKGDTRYEQVIERLKSPRPIKETLFQSNDPAKTLIAGSTWKEDEDVLIEVIQQTKDILRYVLVPHEPNLEHLRTLQDNLKNRDIEFTLYSKDSQWTTPVLIVDQIGFLAELYQKGIFAFVGGSFKSSVHSVMEPLAAGSLTFVGPKYTNNREAIEFSNFTMADLSASSPPQVVTAVMIQTDASSWCSTLKAILHRLDNQNKKNGFEVIRDRILQNEGPSKEVIRWVMENRIH